MKAKKALLFLNGEQPFIYPNDFSSYDGVFAIDGAYIHLRNALIIPDVVIGDFDLGDFSSFVLKDDPLTLKNKEKQTEFIHTPNQDYTDFEKALNILYEKGFLEIDIWGASGKEQDHFLGNLSAALKYKDRISMMFYDNYQHYFFSPSHISFPIKKNKIVSLFPFPLATDVYTKGLQYPLKGDKLDLTYVSLRNKALEEKIEITFKQGALLIFIER